jgi:hypothetical protein
MTALRPIILVLICFTWNACAVIRKPGTAIDSTIIKKDSFHTVIIKDTGRGRDSIIYSKKQVQINTTSDLYFKPLAWYTMGLILTAIAFLIVNNNK